MHELINNLLDIFLGIGYPGIVLLMTVESSFIPFPSEVVIPPAAYLAQQGQLNIVYVILAGIAGSLLGAAINYLLALTLGRRIIYALADTKFARILLINGKKIEKAEKYFLKYGTASTFLGRLVPAVRQLISIPAGFSRMNLRNFLVGVRGDLQKTLFSDTKEGFKKQFIDLYTQLVVYGMFMAWLRYHKRTRKRRDFSIDTVPKFLPITIFPQVRYFINKKLKLNSKSIDKDRFI